MGLLRLLAPSEPPGTSRIGGNNSKTNFGQGYNANELRTTLKTNNDLPIPFSVKFSRNSNSFSPNSVKENSPNLSFSPKSSSSKFGKKCSSKAELPNLSFSPKYFPDSFGENASQEEKSPNRSYLPRSSCSNFGESSSTKVKSPNFPFSPKSLVSSDYNYDRNSSLNTTESSPNCDFENSTSFSISFNDDNSCVEPVTAVPFQGAVTSLEGVTSFCPAAESSPLHSVDFDKTGNVETSVDAHHSFSNVSISSAGNLSDISLDLDNVSCDDSVTNLDHSKNDSQHSHSSDSTDKSVQADKSKRSYESINASQDDKNDISQETVDFLTDESFNNDDSDPDFVVDLSSVDMSSPDTTGTVGIQNPNFVSISNIPVT